LHCHVRPTDILDIHESPIEDLLLDAAILDKVLPREEGELSLKEEIKRKRSKYMVV